MGRHSSPRQWPYVRSIVKWFAPWIVIGAVVVAALWSGLGAVLGKNGGPNPSAAAASGPKSTVSETPTLKPTPTKVSTPAATKPHNSKPKPKPKPKPSKAPALITKGISVQVLNATGVSEAAQRMADRLASAGFQIVAVDTAVGHYTKTTVYWAVPSAKSAAEAMAAHYGWQVGPKPPSTNLSSTVDIHVIVGDDEANSF
jgi:LytR cell envelope-related transcriptional attenuator